MTIFDEPNRNTSQTPKPPVVVMRVPAGKSINLRNEANFCKKTIHLTKLGRLNEANLTQLQPNYRSIKLIKAHPSHYFGPAKTPKFANAIPQAS